MRTTQLSVNQPPLNGRPTRKKQTKKATTRIYSQTPTITILSWRRNRLTIYRFSDSSINNLAVIASCSWQVRQHGGSGRGRYAPLFCELPLSAQRSLPFSGAISRSVGLTPVEIRREYGHARMRQKPPRWASMRSLHQISTKHPGTSHTAATPIRKCLLKNLGESSQDKIGRRESYNNKRSDSHELFRGGGVGFFKNGIALQKNIVQEDFIANEITFIRVFLLANHLPEAPSLCSAPLCVALQPLRPQLIRRPPTGYPQPHNTPASNGSCR